MSYFMTIAGSLPPEIVPREVELVPASQAQPYIASLSGQLAESDGEPVYLVHDRVSGTSDDLVAGLVSALLEGSSFATMPAFRVMEACIDRAINFRVWYANNDPSAYRLSTTQASDLPSVLAALQNHQGVWWHAASSA